MVGQNNYAASSCFSSPVGDAKRGETTPGVRARTLVLGRKNISALRIRYELPLLFLEFLVALNAASRDEAFYRLEFLLLELEYGSNTTVFVIK